MKNKFSGNGHSKKGFSYDPAKAQPILSKEAAEIQPFGKIVKLPNGLSERTCQQIVERLNQLLADTMTLRDMYKKHHWQVVGPTFYQLHLLFDKHYDAQVELVDQIAERIQMLGGVSYAMAADVAENTNIERPPKGRESVPVQIQRLLDAHEIVIQESRATAKKAAALGDDATNDMLAGDVIATNEMQVWFLSSHLVDAPLVIAEQR